MSNDKCSDIYPGPNPFSEIETLNIKNFVETLDPVPVLGTYIINKDDFYIIITAILIKHSEMHSKMKKKTSNRMGFDSIYNIHIYIYVHKCT